MNTQHPAQDIMLNMTPRLDRYKSLLLIIAAATLSFTSTLASSNTEQPKDYRSRVLGNWNCQTSLSTEYGTYTIVGTTTLKDSGELISEGDIAMEHPSVNVEIPMTFVANGTWSFENNRIISKDIDGDISTPYPILDTFTSQLKNQIGTEPVLVVQLTKIGNNTMVLRAEDDSSVNCVRAHLVGK
jgi:hypothetical protein